MSAVRPAAAIRRAAARRRGDPATAARRSMAWMIAFVALWALVEAIAADLHRRYSPWQVVWTRYAVHLALMGAAFGWRDPASLWRTPRPLFQLARSLLMVASFAHAAPVAVAAPLAYLQLPIGLALAAAAGHPILRPGALAGLVLVGVGAAAAWLLAPRLVSRDPE